MRKGFTLVEIMIVVAIIGILIAIAVPGFIQARERSRANACSENLTKIDGAKEQWALETKAGAGDPSPDLPVFVSGGYLKRLPQCPASGVYTMNPIGSDPLCDATTTGKATLPHALP